ncbi:hypothetical protein WMY93_019137 [Mugilogobius chulae]|uniref:Uncharacterized protein n=1 Tax=Mugilogobius chulae TaxID=88201 RepID=A0AAW0NIW7_9GOBI
MSLSLSLLSEISSNLRLFLFVTLWPRPLCVQGRGLSHRRGRGHGRARLHGGKGRGFTLTQDYEDSTIIYSFYSNTSHDEFLKFLNSSDFDEEESVATETPLETTTMATLWDTPTATTAGGGAWGGAGAELEPCVRI